MTLALTASAQTLTQQGSCYRYNGKNPRTPLSNVLIKYGSGNNETRSDDNGYFELQFTNLKMGDRIGLVTVTKREMMVFNQHAVDEWSIRKEPLCLILCDADEFDRQKKEYMELGRKDAKLKYDRQKAELEKQLEEGKIKQEDLEKALNVAYERLKKLQEEIDKYADDLARIDLSELDSKMQEILEMYQRGETEEAIERLKSLKLAEEFDKETAHNEALQQKLQKSDSKLQTLIEQMKNSVALLKNSGEWEEASKYLKRIADKVNTYNDVFAYAYFCQNQNNHQEAIDYYNRAIQLIDEDKDKNSWNYQHKRAILLNNLAVLYNDTRRYTESEAMYQEALEIRRRLAQDNPKAYEPNLAMTLNNLGILYKNTQRYTESEPMYLKALEIYRRLAQDNPQAYEPSLATTLNNLASLYSNTQRLSESEAMYLEALEIRKRLAKDNPQTYEPDVAKTLYNLANLYKSTQRYTESEAMYIEALEILRRLATANPQAHEPDLTNTLNNFASLYQDTQRYTESEAMCLEALEIRRRLAKDNPQAYEPDVAQTLNNLAILYQDAQRYTESEAMHLEALETYRHLTQDNPQTYEPSLATALNNLANLYSDTQRLTESEAMYLEALEIRRPLAMDNPQAYEPDLAATLYNIGLLYIQQEQYFKAISDFEESLAIYRTLKISKPSYGDLYQYSLYWLTQLYPTTDNHARHYEINEEWLPILKEYYQEDAESYRENYVNALGSQSFQCIFVSQYEKSEQYAREALAIDSSQHWINTNLAASLLLQDKYDEAKIIYRQYKDELKDSFLQDLNDFETAGVIPKERKADLERIRQMLNE